MSRMSKELKDMVDIRWQSVQPGTFFRDDVFFRDLGKPAAPIIEALTLEALRNRAAEDANQFRDQHLYLLQMALETYDLDHKHFAEIMRKIISRIVREVSADRVLQKPEAPADRLKRYHELFDWVTGKLRETLDRFELITQEDSGLGLKRPGED